MENRNMGIIGKIKELNEYCNEICTNTKRLFFYHRNPVYTHKYIYKKAFNKELDLNNPQTLNEKIQYLIVNKYGEFEAELSDKIKVKEYVNSLNIDGLYVPKTIKSYKNANDIDLSELPEKFVIKCNHRSGGVFVCTDKSKFDIDGIRKVLNKMLKENFAKVTYEYHYKYIEPRIMVEEYISDGTGKMPYDYKFYVFNGKADRLLLCSDRANGLRQDDFDTDWNYLDDTLPELRSSIVPEKPSNLSDLVRISEELCMKDGIVNIPFARVDLYSSNDKVYFGEYTFSPARGLEDVYYDRVQLELGNKLDLSAYN